MPDRLDPQQQRTILRIGTKVRRLLSQRTGETFKPHKELSPEDKKFWNRVGRVAFMEIHGGGRPAAPKRVK